MLHLQKKHALVLAIAAMACAANLGATPLPDPTPPIPTTLTYDQMGMPLVVSGDTVSGYTELCYAMAKDRLFQMDLLRRSAYGQLAEIFGAGPADSVLQQDLTLRVQDISVHAANRLGNASLQTRRTLTGCSFGINRFIDEATQAGTLPLEFTALNYAPESWAPKDSVAILIYLGAGFSNIGTQTKLQRAALGGVFGPEIANALIPPIPENSMFDADGNYIPPNSTATAAAAPSISFSRMAGITGIPELRRSTDLPNGLSVPQLQATNSFVVDGSRTASGKPILANDPHLALNMPTAFYFAQLNIKGENGFNIRGATIPGAPIFLSAQNELGTWGISVAGTDGTDLYQETITRVGDTEYVSYGGNLIPVIVKQEKILVAGREPVDLRVRTTPHGTILNDALPALDPFGPIAIKDTFAQSAWKIDGYFDLPRVRNWNDFKNALTNTGIGLNFLYADSARISGNIGYQLAGLIPLRNPENLYVPVSGADGQHEWTGFASAAQRPSVLNPSNHFLAVANNRIVPSNYAPGGVPVSVGGFLEQPWRMQRVAQLLEQAGSALVPKDLMQMQLDTHNAVGKQMADLYAGAFPADHPDASGSLAALQAWDGSVDQGCKDQADPDCDALDFRSKGAAVYEVLTTLLIQDTLMNVIGPDFYQNYMQGVFVTRRVDALRNLLVNPRAPFFGIGPSDDPIVKRDLAIRAALARTDELLKDALGADNENWTWGKLHTLTYNHPLAAPGNPFYLPTYPADGDFATLNIGWWGNRAGLLALPADELAAAGGVQAAFAQDAIASVRVAWDQSSPWGALGVSSTGQSGNPFSPHWADQAEIWRAGSYRVFSYDGIEAY